MFSRRQLLKMGLTSGAAALFPYSRLRAADLGAGNILRVASSPDTTPFQHELLIPPILQPVADLPGGVQCEVPGQMADPILYELPMRVGEREIIPGTITQFWGYAGQYPGPTIKVRRNRPVVIRFLNDLDLDGVFVETSVHNHGGHQAAEADGFPNDFIFPGEFKDYCYPNIAPEEDDSDFASTQWYHDHTMDITAENVYMGLAGFYILTDDIEDNLKEMGRLPGDDFDIALVVQDRVFDREGNLVYDPMDHDGFLGDKFLVNGVIQPKFHVQRRKYRFRILNGANARLFEFRLSTGQPFLQIGNDSWLLPFAVQRDTIKLSMAERAEVIIDFTNAPDELFLENILEQVDGRGPKDRRRPGTPLMKFVVHSRPSGDDVFIEPGDALRPHTPIEEREIVRTRRFVFERRNGVWVVNKELFDPDRDDARPRIGTAERWILENKSGGWVHPIHIHLEAHQIQRLNGHAPPPHLAAKKDTVLLGENGVAEVFMKFRTFPGRFAFHCHNLEHEDMRMMGVFNVVEG